jgi:probable F420-dependent oxidoreductase
MRFGLSVYDVSATELADLAAAAETAGFDTLWLGEHLLRPVDYRAVHPTREPETRLTDPLVALAAAAGRTCRLQLATGIFVLPLRHPLAVARAVLTLQELAEGRLLFGVGLGWLREEFEALGVPFDGRAARFTEGLDILRKAWAGGPFEHHGSVYDFGPVELTAQPARIPLVLGGNTAPALGRAALRADGWFASGTPSSAEAVDLMARLDAAQAAAGRVVPLTAYVRASRDADVTRYAAAGYSQLVFWAHELCPPGPARWDRLAAAAAELGVTEGARP